MFFNFRLSIDEDVASFATRSYWSVHLRIGRWGTNLLNQVFFYLVIIAYLSFLIGIICQALSAVLLTHHTAGTLRAKKLFITVFITTPVHAYYLTFNTAALILGLAMLFRVISFTGLIRAINQTSRILFYVSVPFLVFPWPFIRHFLHFFSRFRFFTC